MGYSDGHMAVEFYQGSWILRAALPSDLPLTGDATQAMAEWRKRNAAKFKECA